MTIHVTPIPRLISLTAPAFTLGTSNAAGSAITAVASDSTLLAFDSTLPAAVGSSATGSATTVSHRDHVHAGTTLATPSLTLGTANSTGSATTALATDATILVYDATAVDAITFGQSGSVGSSSTASRRDHAHAMEAETTGGLTKCWGYVSNDGTLQSPSYNIESVTDVGTGIRTPVFDTPFSDDDYAIAVQVRTSDAVGTHSDISAIAVGSFTWKIYNNANDALQDSEGGFQAIGSQ